MVTFRTELVVEPLSHREWEVKAPFVVETIAAGILEVPTGFIFDGNSLPRFLWLFSTPADYLEAGCVHDYLYRTGKVSRKIADQTYQEILTYLKANRVRTKLRYVGLRLFGGKAYRG